MKRITSLLFMMLAAVSSIWAYDFKSGDLCYEITSENTVKVVQDASYKELTTVNIPATVANDGTTYDVTCISYYAFQDCSNLVSVNIPSSIKSLESCSFERCVGLTSVIIPDGVEQIEAYVFNGCI